MPLIKSLLVNQGKETEMARKISWMLFLVCLGFWIWFKSFVIPHVTYKDLYLNAKQVVGLQSIEDIPGLKERIEKQKGRKS